MRYFKTGMNLHCTQCFDCKVLFSYETVEGEGCYMPSTVQPVYLVKEGTNLIASMVCALDVISCIQRVVIYGVGEIEIIQHCSI